MGFFTDDPFVELTDANEKPEANGRKMFFNRELITVFYRREVNQDQTNIFTADGRAYTVQESYDKIKDLLA